MKTTSKSFLRNGSRKNGLRWNDKHTLLIFTTSNAVNSTSLRISVKNHQHTNSNGQDEAVKRIKNLHRHNKQSMIKEAFEIYNNLDEIQKNKFVINALLDCCKKISKQQIDGETMKVIEHIKSFIINDNTNIYGKNTLITIYSQCKDIKNATKIFDSIPEIKRNIYSIGAMMTAYNNNQQYHKTISLYQQYDNIDYIKHNDTSNMLFIKACINDRNYDKCKKLIDSIIIKDINYHSIEFITTLIDFYGKIGDVDKALNVFNNLKKNKRNIASINSMMNAYNNNKQYDKSILLHEKYIDGINDNDISNVLFIKACINHCNYDKAKKFINSNINKQALNNRSIELINTLIDFYGKSSDIDIAFKIFNEIPSYKKDIVSINAMMTTFNHNKNYHQTISLYEQHNDIIKYNEISNLLFIKACSNSGHYDKAKKIIHLKFKNINLNNYSIEFVTTLIDFYGKAGDIDNALKIFRNFPENKKSIISIGAMMNAYINNKEYEECISLYEKFGGQHNDISNMLFIKACINSSDYDKGLNFINSITKGTMDINIHSVEFINTLIDFYGKFGNIDNAVNIFNNLSENKRNFVLINSMMNAYNNNQQYHKAILLYQQYYQLLIHDDTSNMLFIKACINNNDYDKGQKLIDSISKHIDNINKHNIEFITALILFYCKKGDIVNASNIFNNISENKKNMIQIDAMMNAYNNNEEYDKTILIYQQFKNNEYEYNDISNTLFIKACSNIGHYDKAKDLIDTIESREGINNHDTEFINSLIVFYGKHGDIDNALNIFNKMPLNKKNTSSIGAMMNVFNHNEQYIETINLFNKIKDDINIIMNEYIYSTALIAAGNLVSLYQGSTIIQHLKLNNPNILQSLFVQSAMISMYAKCNKFEKATNIFNESINNYADNTQTDKNGLLYLYSAIMDCYAKMGDIEQVLLLFDKLKKDKRITKITKSLYNIVLNGCSHSGLIDKALLIFDEIKSQYQYNKNNIDIQSITPLIDGLGRTGHDYYLDKAENLYKIYILNNVNIDCKLKLPALYSLLSSCRVHNDIIRAQRIFDMIMSIDPNDENACITLSNIYGQNKEFDKVNQVREMIEKQKNSKYVQ